MAVAGALALFPVATLAISLVESPPLAIPDASPIYLVAVVGVAVVLGTPAAITAAFLSFVLYDWLFVAPRFTLIVQDPTEWLNLLLLLFVGIVIGRLAALQSERAEDAARRARESQALARGPKASPAGGSIRLICRRIRRPPPTAGGPLQVVLSFSPLPWLSQDATGRSAGIA